jgi:hypothetical protein
MELVASNGENALGVTGAQDQCAAMPVKGRDAGLITPEHIRQVYRVTLDCVRLAFSLDLLFESDSDGAQNPTLAKMRDQILGKVGDLRLYLLGAIGPQLHEFFGVANARAGRSERIEVDGTELEIYHDYGVYLLMALDMKGRRLPRDRQRSIEHDIKGETKRALAFLDLAQGLESVPSDDRAVRVAELLDQAQRTSLEVIEKLIYEIKGMKEDYKAARAGVTPVRRVSLAERKAILIGDDRYLPGAGITITAKTSQNPVTSGGASKTGAGNEGAAREGAGERSKGHSEQRQRVDWGQVRIRFLDGNTVSVWRGQKKRCVTAGEIGLADKRSGKPSKLWKLLQYCADNDGQLSKDRAFRQGKVCGFEKSVQRLNRVLCAHFGASNPPLVSVEGGYRCLISLDPGEK